MLGFKLTDAAIRDAKMPRELLLVDDHGPTPLEAEMPKTAEPNTLKCRNAADAHGLVYFVRSLKLTAAHPSRYFG